MATLLTLINANPNKLIKVTRAGVEYQFNSISGESALMYDGSLWGLEVLTDWSLVQAPLAEQKTARLRDIDNKTQELIEQGFSYASNTFSLSIQAQGNWNALLTLDNSSVGLTYPYPVTTIDDDDEYEITSSTDLAQFCGAAFQTAGTHVASGRALKLQVQAATTQAELDAVIDNR